MIEPRKIRNPGASAIQNDLGSTVTLVAAQSVGVRAGSKSRANAHGGSPGTWEAVPISTAEKTGGGRSINAQARGRRVPSSTGNETRDAAVVPRGEGNRASGKGGSGQSTPIVPVKRENPPQGILRREEGCREAPQGRGPAVP